MGMQPQPVQLSTLCQASFLQGSLLLCIFSPCEKLLYLTRSLGVCRTYSLPRGALPNAGMDTDLGFRDEGKGVLVAWPQQ